MYKIDRGAVKSLEKISSEFYSKLNPIKKSGALRKNSLKKRILKKYNTANDVSRKSFYGILIERKFKLLRKIIIGKPSDLKAIIERFDQLVQLGHIPRFYDINGDQISATSFGEEVLETFNYKGCRGSIKFRWWAHEIGNKVCPYCNHGYTFIAGYNEDEKILFDVDHFIAKVKAPYLSLSFYNLLPSCHVCNSHYKLDQIFDITTHIHPYIDNFDSLCQISIDKIIVDNDPKSFKIIFNTKTKNVDEIRKSTNHINDFKLEVRFENFNDEVIFLNNIRNLYPEKRKLDILAGAEQGFPAFANRIELAKYIAKYHRIPFDKTEARNIIVGKLKLDIAREWIF